MAAPAQLSRDPCCPVSGSEYSSLRTSHEAVHYYNNYAQTTTYADCMLSPLMFLEKTLCFKLIKMCGNLARFS